MEGKNAAAVQLLKHSGQSESLVFSCSALPAVCNLLDKILFSAISTDDSEKEKVLLSAAQKILLFESLFEHATSNNVENLFINTFDSDAHQGNAENFLHKQLPKFYVEHCISGHICTHVGQRNQTSPSKAFTFGQMLRMLKFFVEKGDDSNGGV